MITKLYINNFKCFSNFELNINSLNSAFFVGKNGTGKTSIFEVIEFFHQIGQGVTSLSDLIKIEDFGFNGTNLPIHFEIEVKINNNLFKYTLKIDFPQDFLFPRINTEKLEFNSEVIFERNKGQTNLGNKAHFLLDWHHIGIPLIIINDKNKPIEIFKDWLKKIIILAPIPKEFKSISNGKNEDLIKNGANIANYISQLLSSNPSLYSIMSDILKKLMPDLDIFKFKDIGATDKELLFEFKHENSQISLKLHQLSDGEKIFFLAATILATKIENSEILCIWDEPDNFIALSELGNLILKLRKHFESSGTGQILFSSHSETVINSFSEHNTFILSRESHTLPTRVRLLEDMAFEDTFINALKLNEIK